MKIKSETTVIRNFYILSFFLLVISVLSVYLNISRSKTYNKNLAVMMGRTFFKEIVVTRRWNANHGGVYIPVGEKIKPNPYLEDPLRDITTTEGMKLTKINPAYMTRLISEILTVSDGVKFHITSLNPIRPDNKPDEWEKTYLENFEKGIIEEHGIFETGKAREFRYMAPLKTEVSCLKCHAKQGYKAGDIRGGISVTFSLAPFDEEISSSKTLIYSIHAFFYIVVIGIILLLSKRLIKSIRETHEAALHIKRLEGLLPICSSCKKIRTGDQDQDLDQRGKWVPIEGFIQEKTDAEFTHGLCPDCLHKLYPGQRNK
ncbi:DUF3365 domain-containing protein [candidate division KSB1 bacterium]